MAAWRLLRADDRGDENRRPGFGMLTVPLMVMTVGDARHAPVLTQNSAFIPGGNWLVPTTVLQPRFVKFSASIDF